MFSCRHHGSKFHGVGFPCGDCGYTAPREKSVAPVKPSKDKYSSEAAYLAGQGIYQRPQVTGGATLKIDDRKPGITDRQEIDLEEVAREAARLVDAEVVETLGKIGVTEEHLKDPVLLKAYLENPVKPEFLGTATIGLSREIDKDTMEKLARWHREVYEETEMDDWRESLPQDAIESVILGVQLAFGRDQTSAIDAIIILKIYLNGLLAKLGYEKPPACPICHQQADPEGIRTCVLHDNRECPLQKGK